VEVGNLLTRAFQCALSSTLIFDYPTANALATYLIETIFPKEPAAAPPAEQRVSTAEIDHMLSELEAMPDADASRLFRRAEPATAGVPSPD